MATGEFRLRICFAKQGRLRFLSHLEVMRALERSARRASLPYAVTKGFNPHMKVAFGPALPVGSAGEREYYDAWLREYVPAPEVMRRLQAATPADLAPRDARYVHHKERSLAAECTIAEYRVMLEGEEVDARRVDDALAALIAEGSLETEHKRKTKVFDLARSLPKEARVSSCGEKVAVEVTVRMGQEGSLRPEVLIGKALSRIGCHGVDMFVTRTGLFIEEDDAVRRPI